MGGTPCVPLPTVLDALAHNSGGSHLQASDITILKQSIGMDIAMCGAQCIVPLWDCLEESVATNLNEKMNTL